MKKNLVYICFSAMLICIPSYHILAQEYTVPNVFPPSPNAASLIKYAGIKPGLSSGAINVNIPLLEFTSRSLKLPISLNYFSNGFKVGEIASRVGTGWSLDAGGVISSTVYGGVDGGAPYMMPPTDFLWPTNRKKVEFLNLLSTGDMYGLAPGKGDGQPDIFSFNFNGNIGKFILDTVRVENENNILARRGQPILLTHSGLKIEKIGTASPTNFKATTTEGIQYFFDTIESTSNVNSGSSVCNTVYSDVSSISWYLTRIVHPNKDTINLSYSPITTFYNSGIIENIFAGDPNQLDEWVCYFNEVEHEPIVFHRPLITNNTCVSTLRTIGVMLNEISSTTGGKIKFNYTSRLDYDVNNADKLVSSIEVYQPTSSSPFKTYTFNYHYNAGSNRPFLTSCVEKDSELAMVKIHKLAYNAGNIPPMLSFAQDHWGYYNGATNNTTLIPYPKEPSYRLRLPEATANREPDPNFSKIGLLSSITYPTGGKDSIQYEGNQAYTLSEIPPTYANITTSVDNTYGGYNYSYSNTAVILTKQLVTVTGNCTSSNELSTTTIQVTDENNNLMLSATIPPNQSFNQSLELYPGVYRLFIGIEGDNTVATGSLDYMAGAGTIQYMNTNIGGVRVAKVLTYDNMNSTPSVKKYSYYNLDNPEQSSGARIYTPRYENYYKMYNFCGLPNHYEGNGFSFNYYHMSANSIDNIYAYESPTTYANVIENLGENGENGRIEHAYSVGLNFPAGDCIGGDVIDGIPMTSMEWANGKEHYRGVFKKNGSSFMPVNKTFTSYKEDPRVNETIGAYSATKKYAYPGPVSSIEPNLTELQGFNMMGYYVYRKWLYPDTVRTQTFDATGTNYAEQINVTEYGDPDHALVTKNISYSSKGDKLETRSTYPSIIMSTPYSDMASRRMFAVIEKEEYKNDAFLKSTKTTYNNWNSESIFAPLTVESRTGTEPYQIRIRYHNYDDQGNVLSISNESGPKENYVWGYGGRYPIAKIAGTGYTAVETALGGRLAIKNFRNNLFPSSVSLGTFLAPLRMSLNEIPITSYTYFPLIGPASMTDPKGLVTFFEYDSFQRLRYLKDQNGNVVKSYDYHYKP